MTEEAVTKALLLALTASGWTILAFDYPGSGTGRLVRPLGSKSKNAGGLIPDIVAARGEEAVWVECKDRLSMEDLRKIERARQNAALWLALNGLAPGARLRAGLGMPLLCLPAHVPPGVDFMLGVGDGEIFARGADPPIL